MVLEYDKDEQTMVHENIKLSRMVSMTREVLKDIDGFKAWTIANMLA